jgi:hypothetical protein
MFMAVSPLQRTHLTAFGTRNVVGKYPEGGQVRVRHYGRGNVDDREIVVAQLVAQFSKCPKVMQQRVIQIVDRSSVNQLLRGSILLRPYFQIIGFEEEEL